MTQAAIGAEIHQPLDIHRDFAAEVALDHIFAVDHFADLQHFGIGQLIDARSAGIPIFSTISLANFRPIP